MKQQTHVVCCVTLPRLGAGLRKCQEIAGPLSCRIFLPFALGPSHAVGLQALAVSTSSRRGFSRAGHDRILGASTAFRFRRRHILRRPAWPSQVLTRLTWRIGFPPRCRTCTDWHELGPSAFCHPGHDASFDMAFMMGFLHLLDFLFYFILLSGPQKPLLGCWTSFSSGDF